jgi:hypothetical protein
MGRGYFFAILPILYCWDISPLGIADILANRQKAKEEAERQKLKKPAPKGHPF